MDWPPDQRRHLALPRPSVTLVPVGHGPARRPDRRRRRSAGGELRGSTGGSERVRARGRLRIPARLTLYSVLGQSSERYSYLVGRTDEQAFWDEARDSFRTALEFAAAGVPPELEARTVLLEGAVGSRWLRWVRTMSTCSSVAPEAMAQSAGSCLAVSRRG
jgi:hypothetical protein